ncbi:MAG: double-strand break repair helicase AddA [Pseudomonadota bacterium]|nr:double-strand break repair helicase AddA [Pseudomonadota bacterium]
MFSKTASYDLAPAFDPAASVFVSANAGAGKTSLLTRRVLRLLLHGVAPSRILCLTFTNAAAAEMSNRVTAELGKWVMAEDKALKELLAELISATPGERLLARARSLFAEVLEAPEGVRIQTIHSFCQSLLKRFPVEAGISPHFSIMDSRSEQALLRESRLRLFSHPAQSTQEAIRAIARGAGEWSFHALLEEIIQHKRWLRFLLSRGGLDAAINEMRGRLQAPSEESLQDLLTAHFAYEESHRKQLAAIVLLLQQGSEAERETGLALEAWLVSGERETLMESYLNIFFKKDGLLRGKLCNKNTLTPELLLVFKAEQERAWRFNDERTALEAARLTAHMLCIADGLLANYDQLKQQHALMDYDDLILTASRLLQKPGIAPWVLFKLDGGIDHVLVDEAQDTSPEQWSIIDALTQDFFAGQGRGEQERSLFVVGDEKQSIYSFQGADPLALGRMRSYFLQRIRDAAKPAHGMALIHSYRSTPEILQAVDTVFAQAEARSGLMAESGDLSHKARRTEHAGLVEVWPLFGKDEGESASSVTRLARTIAETIRQWIDSGVMLGAKDRPVEAGDIMILVRSRTPLVDRLVKQLKRRGVPVAGQDRMALADNLAVQDLSALGECLLLPEDDLSLAAALKSPIFGFSEEELFQLAWNRGRKTLWECLSEGKGRYAEAHTLLADLRAKADFISPFELYTYLLDTRGARRRITGRMGEEYNDPLDEFLSQALAYERSHPPSLQGFLYWLASSDSEIKRDMEQSGNAVRILTVHGAKGLQAPIVILPDTVELPKSQEALLWDEQNGIATPFLPASEKPANSFCSSLRQARKQAMMAEYRRLLYVALTRAEDRLYICGATNRKGTGEECWYHLVSSGLAPIAQEFEMPWGRGLRLGTPPATGAKRSVISPTESSPHKGDFIFLSNPAPLEPLPSRPITPSRPSGTAAAASPTMEAIYQRGLLIHKLLQYLPYIAPAERQRAGAHIAAAYPEALREECLREALAVLGHPEFSFLFKEDSLAEAPVAGCVEIGGNPVAVAGQIDRLYIGEREVWIVDYKSNRMAPPQQNGIPAAYLRQMRLYRQLLRAIYPGKTVRCALLWTTGPKFTVLDEAQLDEVGPASYI